MPKDYEGDRLLRLSEVMRRTGMSRSTIYRWMNEGLFPAALKVGPMAVRWREREVSAFMASRPRAVEPQPQPAEAA